MWVRQQLKIQRCSILVFLADGAGREPGLVNHFPIKITHPMVKAYFMA